MAHRLLFDVWFLGLILTVALVMIAGFQRLDASCPVSSQAILQLLV